MSFEHQDHNIIVWNKKEEPKEIIVKPKIHNSDIKIKTEEDGEEIVKIEKFSHAFIQEVIQKRNSKNMKRKDLAQKLGIPENELARFEQNKMIYKGAFVDKIKRILGRDFTSNPKL
jgi:ribosome-binding protein aMBF1 (putative translation factor)